MAGSADHQVTRESAREQSEPATIALESSASFDLEEEIKNVLDNNHIGLSSQAEPYFPDSEYDRLFTTDTVRNALGGSHDVSSLVEYVIDHAKGTFATLLLTFSDCKDLREVMHALMIDGFNDDLLENQELDKFYFRHRLWGTRKVKVFMKARREFIVATFDIKIFKYEFDTTRLLPFMRLKDTETNGGHFSEVKCVEMLASKQNKVKVPEKMIKVALKKLKRIPDSGYNIKREWDREVSAHQRLNQKSANIIQAFGAYRQFALKNHDDYYDYYLVLEWANGGNLFNFWIAHPEPQVDDPDVGKVRWRIKEMLEQLHGLAGALDAMHSTRSMPEYSSSSSVSNSPALLPQKSADGRENSLGADVPLVNGSPLPSFNFNSTEADDDNTAIPSIVVSPGSADLKVPGTPGGQNWRHGDIKPENILRFLDDKNIDSLGVLKLADLGRAQQHQFVTNMRNTKETEEWRTRWYEPPDLEKKMHEKAQGKISRLFDIWSMGCVIFEAVLWLLYGYESYGEFVKDNGFTTGEKGATPYWRKDNGGNYLLTQAFTNWMEHILTRDPERNGAIGELVKLVRDRLLKINLPPNSDFYSKGFRTNAQDLKKQLGNILTRANEDERYLFSGATRLNVPRPHQAKSTPKNSSQSTNSSLLSISDSRGVDGPIAQGRRTRIAQQRVYTNSMKDEWATLPEDSLIVDSMLKDRTFSCTDPDLCRDCRAINISSLHIETSHTLETRDDECDLCKLIYTAAKDQNLTSRGNIQEISLKRFGRDLFLKHTDQKFLRLIETNKDTGIPLAAPELASLTSSPDPRPADLDSFVKLPKMWLRECNDKHGDVCALKNVHILLPTRLISVEKPKIVVTTDLKNTLPGEIRYIALSHTWGDMPPEAVTTKRNLEKRKKKIPLDELPLSFRNAIAITKALNCTYLWIDSLCILQGPDGDFNEEADRMQTTFNGAYCVLAACSAQSAKDGFLKSRESRSKSVKVADVFVSPVTNDFERDVLRSPLSRRGWVLQERALARRTIYFTETQTYWECGHGIRCETLTKLKNDKVAFLGDPNFPDYTIRAESTVGEQINLFINLFQNYSRLEFSRPEDRPIAIDGLMDRLTDAFKTRSLAGLFETFWGRCLLWQRAHDAGPLKKIPHGIHSRRTPPTWSWMAFEGEISFIDPEGGQVVWNSTDITLPFGNLTRDQTSWLRTSCHNDSVAIEAKAFDFSVPAGTNPSEAFIYYDGASVTSTKCVIIGTNKQQVNDEKTKKHYVLIVKPVSDILGASSYERCGVGYMMGKFIRSGNSIPIMIE